MSDNYMKFDFRQWQLRHFNLVVVPNGSYKFVRTQESSKSLVARPQIRFNQQ